MKKSNLLILFFIVFISNSIMVGVELVTYAKVQLEVKRIDRALEYAFAAAGDALNGYVYNDNVERIIMDSFVYAYSAHREDIDIYELTENYQMISGIHIFINGYEAGTGERMEVTDYDRLGLQIELEPIMITAFNRTFWMNRIMEGEVRGAVL